MKLTELLKGAYDSTANAVTDLQAAHHEAINTAPMAEPMIMELIKQAAELRARIGAMYRATTHKPAKS